MSQESRARYRWLEELASDFKVNRIAGTVATGMVLALVNALLTLALVSLIFRGPLEVHLDKGIGLGLVAATVISLAIALGSGVSGAYAGIQDASAAILGLAAASIAVSVAGSQLLGTVTAMIIVTSVTTGLVVFLMGRYRLGEVARFVPFPVVGGLLAGTGLLIVEGSVEILGGLRPESLVGSDASSFWAGVVLAVLFFAASRLKWSSRVYLLLLGISILGFHLVRAISATGLEDAIEAGMTLGPFPDGSIWPGIALTSLADADWSAIAGQAPSLLTILLIVPVTVLLYVSAIEVETRTDLDIGKELKVTGWANLASGVVGGPPGYLYLADTLVTRRLIGARRGAAVVASVVLGAVALVGGTLLELIPVFVIGGMLLFVGFDFLSEWLWEARSRMSRLDHLLVIGIVAIVGFVGFLPGVAAGLVAAVVLFVIRYSQIDVVKHRLSSREHRSNIERSPAQSDYLYDHGEAVLILQLQGFIFFGTANRIVSEFRSKLVGDGELDYLVCDFRLVSGIDSSALVLIERMALLASEHDVVFILSGLSAAQRSQVESIASEAVIHFEPDLDRAVARCEEGLLAASDQLNQHWRGLPEDLIEALAGFLDSIEIEEGEYLMRQGDDSPGLYLLRSGRASVILENQSGTQVRLRTLLPGTLLGEISLYRDEPVTASVVADSLCDLLHLSPENFTLLCREDPAVAADLHGFVARTLAGRVSHANRAIQALQG